MCFSANVSFATSGLLILIGAVSLRENKLKKYIPMALTPCFFAIQQLSEGLLWLALPGNKILKPETIKYFTYIFLFFAFFLWPIWIPFSIYLTENRNKRKLILKALVVFGIFVGCYGAFYVITNGANAEIISNHIVYNVNVPGILSTNFLYDRGVQISSMYELFYLIAVVLPFFVSSNQLLWLFGALLLISLYITNIFYMKFLVSVWCFFAALLSLFIYFIIKKSFKNS